MPDFGDVDPTTGRTNARTEFEGTVDPLAPSVSNGQISPAQWAEYQAKRRRDAILGVLGFLGGTVGGSALSYGLGGYGAAAGSGAAGSASVPGAVGASAAPLGGGTVTGGTLAATPFTSLAPYAGTVAGTGTGAGAGIGAAGGVGSLFAGLTTKDLMALGLSGAGMIGGAMSNGQNFNPTTTTSDPQLAALMRTMQGRLDKSEPLYDSVLNMANGLLPTQYQKGGGGMG